MELLRVSLCNFEDCDCIMILETWRLYEMDDHYFQETVSVKLPEL